MEKSQAVGLEMINLMQFIYVAPIHDTSSQGTLQKTNHFKFMQI